jgi:hypothetical protein
MKFYTLQSKPLGLQLDQSSGSQNWLSKPETVKYTSDIAQMWMTTDKKAAIAKLERIHVWLPFIELCTWTKD